MKKQPTITDHLLKGSNKARTARELATRLKCTRREISERIERERREGQPICATCDPEHPGYYLADTADEIQKYCSKLHRRAGEIYKTRAALLKTAETLQNKA